MTTEIIAAKRPKLGLTVETITNIECENVKPWTIKAILSDEYYEPIRRCFVYVGVLSDIKSISKALGELCQNIPLNELNHLKRVNKSRLVLFSLHEMLEFLELETNQTILSAFTTQQTSLTEQDLRTANEDATASLVRLYLTNHNISPNVITLLTQKIEIASVGAHAPVLSWHYSDVTKDWPCKFHPNKNLEKLYTGQYFSNNDTEFHIEIMKVCAFLCSELKKEVSGIAVDPRSRSIVAIGLDEIEQHPLMHCAMVLIDAVARSQKGGAWNDYLIENNEQSDAVDTIETGDLDEYRVAGVSTFIRKLISSKFPSIKFGAERVKSADQNRQNCMNLDANSDNLAKYGPYLCTGYDVYLWREPCIMCSMALTHSRIRTIFFHENEARGAICSLTKIQSVKSLNHHFQVFHITND